MKYIKDISIWIIVGVFLLAGLDKLFHYKGFILTLDNSFLVPEGFAEFIALPIILSEFWIAIGLIIKSLRSTALLVAIIILLLFTSFLLGNYLMGIPASCGCWFTLTFSKSTGLHILQNLFLLGLSLLLWYTVKSDKKDIKSFTSKVSKV